jgi:hypothetical protein
VGWMRQHQMGAKHGHVDAVIDDHAATDGASARFKRQKRRAHP